MPKKKGTNKSKGKSNNKRNKSKENSNISEKGSKNKRQKGMIKEKKELVHENQFQVNEAIAKSIVDKLIILSIRKSHSNYINRRLENYYFDYMKNQINTLFGINFIYYWDEPEIEQSERKELFFNNEIIKKNTWIEISEPNISKIDRYENAFMNYVNFNIPTSISPSEVTTSLNRQNSSNEKNMNLKNKDDFNDLKIRKNLSKKFSNLIGAKNGINQKVLDTLEEKSSISSIDEENKDNKNIKNNL